MKNQFLLIILLLCLSASLRAQSSFKTENIGLGVITIIEMANNNDVWVGSASQGVGFYNGTTQSWTYFNTSNSAKMKSDSITSLVFGVISGVQYAFIGTKDGLVSIRAGVLDTIAVPDRHISGVSLVGNDTLWAFSPSGVVVFDTARHQVRTYNTGNSTIPYDLITTSQRGAQHCQGYIAGTPNNGAFWTTDYTNFTKIDTSVPNYRLVDNRVNTVYRDNNCNRYAIGTKGGLSLCPQGLPCQNFTTANGLPQNDVTSISQDCAGRFWIGMRDSGVAIFNGTTFSRVTTANGLSDDHVTSVSVAPGDCNGHIATGDGNINEVDSNRHIVKVINGVETLTENMLDVNVYPVPSSSKINFLMGKEINGDISITDLSGRVVKSASLKNQSFTSIDASQMPVGLYFYRVSTSDGVSLKTGKVQVLR